ncbi:sigma-54-dependent transcriptional regulator [Pigmentiphaga litoralis]|uniref:sigma-54-dependent transcriptional regulator n=1 Tax=Pigmentiphaga litoralis TaxID=516702 RepID=UPI003B42E622
MARVLIVDDDDAFRETLAETLEGLGHAVMLAASGPDALHLLTREQADAVFLDHRMPGMDGLQTLAAMQARMRALTPVIVLTAFSSAGNTIDAMRLGAFDHLTKPISRDAVRDVLHRALQVRTAASGEGHPGDGAPDDDDTGDLIGISPAMREVHKRIGLAAGSTQPVLLHGETGTGKEMAARALHRHSSRAGRPFVALNCAAIPKDLLESELFGHVRGAFTGATGDRPGCFRAADGGVLLLDEIGDMRLDVQAKMLRALQEGEITPLGSHRPVKVDVRVIAATHHDLAAAVREGRFREDLLYRLDVLTVRLPPLRERLADILPLAEHFLRLAARAEGMPAKALTADAAQQLLRHAWPGNVRELRNVMARSHALSRHAVIGVADLELGTRRAMGADALPASWLDAELPDVVEKVERLMIVHALAQANGNRAEAARRLGIHRQLLYRKLTAYGLE